jgi:hypothetical protein
MDRTLRNKFNSEVNRYRNSLLFYAKQCDWETFESKAGSLFDYIENVEVKEIERKFFRIFKGILGFLFFAVFFIISVNPEAYPEISRAKEIMILITIAGCCYEMYSFINFRLYMKHKKNLYNRRRERFINNLQSDFRDLIVPALVEQTITASHTAAEHEQVPQSA